MECPSVSSREVHAGHTHTLCHHFVKCACRAPEPPSNLPQLIPAPCPLQLLQQEGREQTGLRLPPCSWHSPGPPPQCPRCWELLGKPGSAGTAGRGPVRAFGRSSGQEASGRFGAGSAGPARCPPPRGVCGRRLHTPRSGADAAAVAAVGAQPHSQAPAG